MSDEQPIDLNDLQRVAVLVRERYGDNWLADMVEIARAEIARLREERMTDLERKAVENSLQAEWPRTLEQIQSLAACTGPVCLVPENKHKAAIRNFLARLPPPPGEGEVEG